PAQVGVPAWFVENWRRDVSGTLSRQKPQRRRAARDVVEVADVRKNQREVGLAHTEPERKLGKELVATRRRNETASACVERIDLRTAVGIHGQRRIRAEDSLARDRTTDDELVSAPRVIRPAT